MNILFVVRLGQWLLTTAMMGLVAGCALAPKPYTPDQFADYGNTNVAMVAENQEPLNKPIDLYEAMARALKYNLNYQVEMRQTSLRAAELNLAHYSFLPNAVASSGYLARNNDQASSSFNLSTGSPNFAASTSQDKRSLTADLTFSWNILDFGLSYVRANQAADRVLIGEEMQRKVKHKLLEDVRTAYWRAYSYERLMAGLQKLEKKTEAAITNSHAIASSQQTSLMTTLMYERELTEIKRTIKELQRNLGEAKSQLAALMNLTPNTAFSLATSSRPRAPPQLSMTLNSMIKIAVRDRSELRQIMYEQRISTREAYAALLEMLPGLQLYAEPGWDSNSYLLNNHWVAWGAKASWNLLKVFQYPAKQGVMESQDQLLAARALATTMAVMTQVHVSRIRFQQSLQELKAVGEYRSVQKRLFAQIRVEALAGRVSDQVALREELTTLISEAKYDIAYAELQSAYANVFASIGRDLYSDGDLSPSVETIAESLRKGGFEHGEAPIKLAVLKLKK